MARPRILLADDHALVAEGLRKLLEDRYELVGIASQGRELVAMAEELRPDVVLLDIAMPIMNGVEAAKRIKETSPAVKMIFVTQYTDRHIVQAALRAGGAGYVLKSSASTELLTAVAEVLEGRYYVTPSVREGVPEALFDRLLNPSELFGGTLTPRQREVLQLVAEGKTGKEIATILQISVKTVEFHKARIMGELGLRTTAELTRYAIEHGVIGGQANAPAG